MARRFMSAPLYEQGHLKRSRNQAPLPLGLPYRPPEHQAMYLTCDDDVLLGRAENGDQAAAAALHAWQLNRRLLLIMLI